MEKRIVKCDACKEEIHDTLVGTAIGIDIIPEGGDVGVRFSDRLSGAEKHACGIKCAMDVVGRELLRLYAHAT